MHVPCGATLCERGTRRTPMRGTVFKVAVLFIMFLSDLFIVSTPLASGSILTPSSVLVAQQHGVSSLYT